MAAVVALAGLALLSVQGCDTGTDAQATPGTTHAVTVGEAQNVFQSYLSSSDAAAEQGDATSGLAAVADAAWEILHGQYTALASSQVAVPRYQYGTPDFIVPALSGYPRWFVVSVPRRQSGGGAAASTMLMAFEQYKSGLPWTLNGFAALPHGQPLPALARDGDGYAIPLSTRDRDLVVPPDIVGATQAAVADDGPTSAAAPLVAAGPYTTGVYTANAAIASTRAAKGLTYTWLLEGASFPVFPLRLAGGGALVLYGMYLNTLNEHPDAAIGAAIPVPANFAPLLSEPGEVGYHEVIADWTYEFAAIDPAASTRGGKLKVIAATGAPSYSHAH